MLNRQFAMKNRQFKRMYAENDWPEAEQKNEPLIQLRFATRAMNCPRILQKIKTSKVCHFEPFGSVEHINKKAPRVRRGFEKEG